MRFNPRTGRLISTHRRKSNLLVKVAAVVLALVVVFGVGAMIVSYNSAETRVCTVTDKDRTTNREGNSDARVYTEECGTLEVADAFMRLHFSSSDTFAQIQPGNRYEFETIGWRIPFFSTFPNIIEVRPVN